MDNIKPAGVEKGQMKDSSMWKPHSLHFKCMHSLNVFQICIMSHCLVLIHLNSESELTWTNAQLWSAPFVEEVPSQLTSTASDFCRFISKLHLHNKVVESQLRKTWVATIPLPKYGWTEAHSCVQRSYWFAIYTKVVLSVWFSFSLSLLFSDTKRFN